MQEEGLLPLSKELIEDVLTEFGWPHVRDRDGDIVGKFPKSSVNEREITAWLSIEGDKDDILKIVCPFGPDIPKQMWPELLGICNEFHRESRIGRAYIDTEDEGEAILLFEYQVMGVKQVTREFLMAFILSSVLSAKKLFHMVERDTTLIQ
jgi:hypothetical protein